MNSFLETLKQLGPARLGMMGAILIGLMVFFVFISMRLTSPEMKLLYSDLSSADSGAMAAKLEESGIAYSVSEDGGRITAQADQVGKARMLFGLMMYDVHSFLALMVVGDKYWVDASSLPL